MNALPAGSTAGGYFQRTQEQSVPETPSNRMAVTQIIFLALAQCLHAMAYDFI